MQVTDTTSATKIAAYTASTTASTTSSQVDSSQFMTILLAQLTHQNPLEPMNNAEMMSQFSQLNSLEELRKINTAMGTMSTSNQTTYMASLIGKTVKVNRPDGNVLEGVVDGAILEKDNPQLRIGDVTFPLSDLLEINGVKA